MGDIVGDSWTTETGDVHAFLYRDGEMMDLNDLIDPADGWVLEQAVAVSDSGHILVDGNDGSPGNHVLLLTPLAQNIDGDLNSDGYVGSSDLDIVRGNWGATVTPGDLASGDVTGDGYVGSGDLDTVRGNWGSGTPPASSVVPEPAALVLFLGAIPIVALLRRR